MERVRRRWWTTTITLAAMVLVLGAVLTASFQLVMQVAPEYRQRLSDYVSESVGQPIDIGGVSLGWSGLAPRLDLTDITLFGEDQRTPALSAKKLRVGFSATRLFHGDATPKHIELSGLELFARIDENGKLSLRGIDTSGMPARATQDWLRELSQFETVRLRQCDLKLEDARLSKPVPDFILTDAEIEFRDGKGSAQAELDLPDSIGSSVIFSAQIAGDFQNPDTWNGRWSTQLKNLRSLPWLNASLADKGVVYFGGTGLNLEGTLEQGKFGEVSVALEADRMEGHSGEHFTTLRDIRFEASLVPQTRGWILDVTELALSGVNGPWPESRARVQLWHQDDGTTQVYAQTDYFLLADLAPWFPLLPGEAAADAGARLGSLSGAVSGLTLDWRSSAEGSHDKPEFELNAEIEDMALVGNERTPGFSSVSGTFTAHQNGGSIALEDSPFTLSYPRIFRAPMKFDAVSGELTWSQDQDGWELSMPSFAWQLDGSAGKGRMDLKIPAQKSSSPQIDLDANFTAKDVRPFKKYIPVLWTDSLRKWLEQAIVAGRADAGHLKISGALTDFPFINKPGTFELDFDATQGELAFAPDWPAVKKLDAHLAFRGNSLTITGKSGSVNGNRVETVRAEIADFHDALLAIHGEVQGDAGNFYNFLRNSPLAPRLAALLTRTQASGSAMVKVDLSIPLKEVSNTRVNGIAQLQGSQLKVNGLPETIVDIRGDLRFDNRSVAAQDLRGRMFGTPVSANLQKQDDGLLWLRGNFNYVADGSAKGPGRLLPGFLYRNLSGSSQWRADIPLEGPDSGTVNLHSDLAGLAIQLPEPMNKSAATPWPTSLRLRKDGNFPLRLTLEIDNRLGVDLAFSQQGQNDLKLQRGRIRTGGGPEPLALDDAMVISGAVAELEPLQWVRIIRGGPSRSASTAVTAEDVYELPLHADLSVGRLLLAGQSIDSVRLIQSPAAAGWETRLSGDGAQGTLGFQTDSAGGTLTGRFERARINHIPKDSDDDNTDIEMSSDDTSPIDPGALPTLNLDIGQLEVGEAKLGRLELLSRRVPNGQSIERFRSLGGATSLEVKGQWLRNSGRSSGDVQFSAESSDIDELLEGLGYAPSIGAERSRIRGQFQWLPSDESAGQGILWSRGAGDLEIELKNGMLRTVKPGAGRVLGLINFWALPRRLTLDFRDVVSEGLGFDEITGNFAIADGKAETDNLDIDAPSLKMKVRGNVGLSARTYNQRITVYPDVSSGVTLGALLIGGPAAAALALIAQEVMDQPLDQVGQLSYRLTGTWDDPQVVKEDAKARKQSLTDDHAEAEAVAAPGASAADSTP